MKWDGQAYAEDIKYGLFYLLTDEEKQKGKTMSNYAFALLLESSHNGVTDGFSRGIGRMSIVMKCTYDGIEFDFQRTLKDLGDSQITLTWSMAARHIRAWINEVKDEHVSASTEKWKQTHLCGDPHGDHCENLLYAQENTVYNGKELDKCCVYCTYNDKVRKISSMALWTGLTPKFCYKRQDTESEGKQPIAKENAAIKNSGSICSTCINNGECISKSTDTCIAYEKATENTEERSKMSLDLMSRYTERTEANNRHGNSELSEQYSSLWGSSTEDIVQIELSKIHSYQTPDGKPQPYRIQPKKVELLMVSIQDIGVLQPILVRENESGYEVLAGHHRFMAAQRTNRNCIPCIVKKDVDDITAYKIVAESNTPTEKVLPSENAVIFKYYMDNRTSGSEEGTVSEISKKFDVSETTVYRHIHLLSLNERLINAVDNSVIPFGRFEKILSNLNADQQETLADYLEMYSVRSFNGKHINLLCTYLQKNSELTADKIDEITHPEKEESKSGSSADDGNTIYKKISDIFPDFSYNQTDLDDLIIKLLSEYMNTENDE